jgi:TRAP-type C4-dicarboxylate transport system permease small subunit
MNAGGGAVVHPLRPRLMRLAEAAALAGGALLLLGIGVTCFSVVRAQFGRPLLGDTEIIELATGAAIALCLPYAQMRGANVMVDFFTTRLSQRLKGRIDAAMAVVFAVVVIVLAARIVQGGFDARRRERASMFLEIPEWWSYAVASFACLLWAVVCLFTAYEAWRGIRPRADEVSV